MIYLKRYIYIYFFLSTRKKTKKRKKNKKERESNLFQMYFFIAVFYYDENIPTNHETIRNIYNVFFSTSFRNI